MPLRFHHRNGRVSMRNGGDEYDDTPDNLEDDSPEQGFRSLIPPRIKEIQVSEDGTRWSMYTDTKQMAVPPGLIIRIEKIWNSTAIAKINKTVRESS